MDKIIEFEVPGQPVQKKSPHHRPAKGGKFSIVQKHQDNITYEQRVIAFLKASGQWDFTAKPHDGPVCLCVRAFFRPLKSWSKKKHDEMIDSYMIKKPDMDRIENMIQDALTGLVFVDDCQVALREPASFKMYSDRPRTWVRIVLMDYEEADDD